MTLYETICTRRQVRKFREEPLEKQILDDIFKVVSETDQVTGQHATFEIVPADAVSGGLAPHYLLGYCDSNSAAYANVGYILQKADLYIQSIGLGSGWFAGIKPKEKSSHFCIGLALGSTDMPMRTEIAEFKRLAVMEISTVDNPVARAVQLAPSAMNSQPWKLEFEYEKIVVRDVGRGLMRMLLRNKLNKIDIGIAARHTVIALENEGKTVSGIHVNEAGKDFELEIMYK